MGGEKIPKIKKQTEPTESAVDREFREIRLDEWKRYAEPNKYLYDYSEIKKIRPASDEEIRIAKNKIKLNQNKI